MNLSGISMGAASMVTQNVAAMNAGIQLAGQNPGPATSSAETQASTQASFSMGVLKQSLDLQASAGAQLASLINQGPGVDIMA
jgi:hypothetical protein